MDSDSSEPSILRDNASSDDYIPSESALSGKLKKLIFRLE